MKANTICTHGVCAVWTKPLTRSAFDSTPVSPNGMVTGHPGTVLSVSVLHRSADRQAVQVDQCRFVQIRTDLATGEDKRHGEPLATAPLEHQVLPSREHLRADAVEAPGVAPFIGVHSSVVEDQIERPIA